MRVKLGKSGIFDIHISHFQRSVQNISLLPGATRSAALHACPWLSYFAPLALHTTFCAEPEPWAQPPLNTSNLPAGLSRASHRAAKPELTIKAGNNVRDRGLPDDEMWSLVHAKFLQIWTKRVWRRSCQRTQPQ